MFMRKLYNGVCRVAAAIALPVTRCWLFMAVVTAIALVPVCLNIAINGYMLRKIVMLDFCQALAVAYMLGWICIAVRRRWMQVVLVSLTAGLSLVGALFVIMSGQPLSAETLMVLMQTDQREAQSFIHAFVTGGKIAAAVAVVVVFAAGVYCVWRYGRRGLGRHRWVPYFCVGVLAVVAVGGVRVVDFGYKSFTGDLARFEQWYAAQSKLVPGLIKLEEYKNGDIFTNGVFAARGLYLNVNELPQWEKTQREVLASHISRSAEADSVNVVVIIGESFIKRHSNIYGYPLLTNPRLTAERDSGRLAVFTDYVSPSNLTSTSLRNLLDLNDLARGESWASGAYFPLVAALGGWRVHLYDNQVTVPKFLVDVQLAAVMRNPMLDGVCYEWVTDSLDRYDGDFVARVNREHPFDGSVGNFDIYHLYGQHFDPADRYPAGGAHDRWTADSLPYDRPWFTPAKRQVVAEYDNATLYNDSVVGAIIDRYRDTPAVVIYFSDHGEEMFDASDCNVRNEPSGDLRGWLERQFEIPFFIWASDSYRAMRPARWAGVLDAVDRPGMLDNVGQAVLGLCGMDSVPYYRPDRDILNPAYRPADRVTLGRRVNYDSLVAPRSPHKPHK